MKRIAIVTGANRGIGFEISRELAKQGLGVVLTSRDPEKGKAAVEALSKEGITVDYRMLDVSDIPSFRNFAQMIEKDFGRLDVLVNNAGILPDESGEPATPQLLIQAFTTNTMGPYFLTEALFPLMMKSGYGRIVNISSGMGQLDEMESGYPAYRLSKTALNAVTRMLASKAEGTNIKVNSMCPGWVRTDMGGSDAERSVEEGADTAIWLSTLPNDGPNGGFFRDRKRIPW